MKNIIVTIDFSSATDRVLAQAVAQAEAFSSKLWLIHVAAPEPEFIGYDTGPQHVRDNVARELRKEHRELQGLADKVRSGGTDATALLVQGPYVEMILAEAEKLDADLIVMGSHGHGAVARLLLGSVSEGVLRKAKCLTLIVPSLK